MLEAESTESIVYCLLVCDEKQLCRHIKHMLLLSLRRAVGSFKLIKDRLKKAIAVQVGLDREQCRSYGFSRCTKGFFIIIKLGSPNTIFNMPASCTVLPSIIEG